MLYADANLDSLPLAAALWCCGMLRRNASGKVVVQSRVAIQGGYGGELGVAAAGVVDVDVGVRVGGAALPSASSYARYGAEGAT